MFLEFNQRLNKWTCGSDIVEIGDEIVIQTWDTYPQFNGKNGIISSRTVDGLTTYYANIIGEELSLHKRMDVIIIPNKASSPGSSATGGLTSLIDAIQRMLNLK